MHDVLVALQNSAFFAWGVGSDSLWAYPMILTMHTVGLGIVVGAAVIIDFRLLGIGPGIPLDQMERVFPIFWVGFLSLPTALLLPAAGAAAGLAGSLLSLGKAETRRMTRIA